MSPRRIGPIGTTVRIVGGLVLLLLALADEPAGLIWGLELYELVLGLLAFPVVMIAISFVGRRMVDGPLRLTGPGGIAANLVAIVALFAIPFTAGAAALFYGSSLLVAAWRGAPHCEAMILSNLILRRDDLIGCPALTPLDALEARVERH